MGKNTPISALPGLLRKREMSGHEDGARELEDGRQRGTVQFLRRDRHRYCLMAPTNLERECTQREHNREQQALNASSQLSSLVLLPVLRQSRWYQSAKALLYVAQIATGPRSLLCTQLS